MYNGPEINLETLLEQSIFNIMNQAVNKPKELCVKNA